jgi:hypothetical protein
MEKNKMWSEFQMFKATAIEKAFLDREDDVLFLDSDVVVTGIIDCIDKSKDIGVSPHYMRKDITDRYGYYNGGMLWTKKNTVPNDWKKFTETSRFFDQASIEDLVAKYSYFEFSDNYNIQGWRLELHPESPNAFIRNVDYDINTNTVLYRNKPVKCIHTHFNNNHFKIFNNTFIYYFKKAKAFKILLVIYRIINKEWVLYIPKQPLQGIGQHANDSYRELVYLLKDNTDDVNVHTVDNSIHCWIAPNILTYDRPTLHWLNNELDNTSLILLGNCDVKIEGKQIHSKYPNTYVRPWIFWPRVPKILEQILKEKGSLSYEERNIESIFIGNYENDVQEKYRNNTQWNQVITEFHCTKGFTKKFTHEEYLLKLRNSRFGLCLRGFGSKCHREVELMAFGTVPIITPCVSIESYNDPLKENIHYILVNDPSEVTSKIKNISKEKWNEMSSSCSKWYEKNINSSNCWNTMIKSILYD